MKISSEKKQKSPDIVQLTTDIPKDLKVWLHARCVERSVFVRTFIVNAIKYSQENPEILEKFTKKE